MGGDAATKAMSDRGMAPKSICQAVTERRSKVPRLRMILSVMALPAHVSPPRTARALLMVDPARCQGSRMMASPEKAVNTAIHCIPRIRSARIGQASNNTQKGMV